MKIVIVGAGISGLATAYALRQLKPGVEIEILESAPRAGGKIWTDKTDEGYVCEAGVHAFLDNRPKTLALAATLGLDALRAGAAARERFIYSRGRLRRVPLSPGQFLRSDLLSLRGRLRLALELVIPRGGGDDETLAEFATRRLGHEACATLIDPMAAGVFAGDARELSVQSCFPRVHSLEQRYGSLIRGMVALQIEARRAGRIERPEAGPGGRLSSFAGGMASLSEALASHLAPAVRLNTGVTAIERAGQDYAVHTTDGATRAATHVVLAAPAYAQTAMLRTLDGELATAVDGIPYPPVAVCCLAYPVERLSRALDGFGFLIPSRERRRILGTVWDSSLFPSHTVAGRVLLRTLVGGARRPDLARLPDAAIVDVVAAELHDIMGIDGEPEFARVYRHEQAIPQYHRGHAARLATIDALLGRHPGLMLTGNAYRGVALNDCIENAGQVAAALVA